MYLLRHDITNLGGFGGSTLHYNFPEIIWDIKREKKEWINITMQLQYLRMKFRMPSKIKLNIASSWLLKIFIFYFLKKQRDKLTAENYFPFFLIWREPTLHGLLITRKAATAIGPLHSRYKTWFCCSPQYWAPYNKHLCFISLLPISWRSCQFKTREDLFSNFCGAKWHRYSLFLI